ncbi:alpha/beta fold hydrolase [Methylobrevis pamukkalensis]|uniref:alpha/beta fold hydrolase n=1 Tax=Methylobrevis pamukkalensis TaxID=1439726 RepID=UPI0014715B8D|nr:alpha/beta fold hydrolase [Methylobrevis pamukkalensis]
MRDGIVLHVESDGDGPALVLAAGLGGSAAFWDPLVPRLASRFRLIRFDHRGVGRSDRPATGHSIARLSADVTDILDALGIDRADFVGHSTGGAIGQELALTAPDRLRRLVLSGTWARADARFRLLFETRIAVLEALGPRAHQGLALLLGSGADWSPAREAEVAGALDIADSMAPLDAAILGQRMRMLLDFDRLDDLPTVSMPTLVVSAEDDMIVSAVQGRAIADAIPGARFALQAGGHFFPRVDPHGFCWLVTAFLEEHP